MPSRAFPTISEAVSACEASHEHWSRSAKQFILGDKIVIDHITKTQYFQLCTKKQIEEQNANSYWSTDFHNKKFIGLMVERVDGLNEEYTMLGELSKKGMAINGNLVAKEKDCKYSVVGSISEPQLSVELKLINLSTGGQNIVSGRLNEKYLECQETSANSNVSIVKLGLKESQ